MTSQSDEIRCSNCGKLLALRLEGEMVIYCPRCHHYAKIFASTSQVSPHYAQVDPLTKFPKGDMKKEEPC